MYSVSEMPCHNCSPYGCCCSLSLQLELSQSNGALTPRAGGFALYCAHIIPLSQIYSLLPTWYHIGPVLNWLYSLVLKKISVAFAGFIFCKLSEWNLLYMRCTQWVPKRLCRLRLKECGWGNSGSMVCVSSLFCLVFVNHLCPIKMHWCLSFFIFEWEVALRWNFLSWTCQV